MALNPFCNETLHLLLNFMDLEDQLKWTCDQVSLNFENKHQDYCIKDSWSDCKIQLCNYFHGAYNRPVMNCVNERTQIHQKKSWIIIEITNSHAHLPKQMLIKCLCTCTMKEPQKFTSVCLSLSFILLVFVTISQTRSSKDKVKSQKVYI